MVENETSPTNGPGDSKSEDQELIGIVWNTLSQVYDPELGMDLVSLGLIYDVSKDGDTINIKMTLTTPGCPASESLPDMAQLSVSFALKDRAKVNLDVVWDPPWDVSMMNPDTAMGLGF